MPILVVDDDATIRLLLSTLLDEEGYVVTLATNGQEALASLHAADPLPCVIILDLMMPIMSGWEFLHIRQADPVVQCIPVVAMSAAHGVAASVAALNVQEALVKPIDFDHLLDILQRYCSGAPPPGAWS